MQVMEASVSLQGLGAHQHIPFMQSISQNLQIPHFRGTHVRTGSGLIGSTTVNLTHNLSYTNNAVFSSQKSNTSLQFVLGGTGGTQPHHNSSNSHASQSNMSNNVQNTLPHSSGIQVQMHQGPRPQQQPALQQASAVQSSPQPAAILIPVAALPSGPQAV